MSKVLLQNKMLPKNRPFRVSVEGNIGSGKSTCLNFFKQWDKVEIHPEPIDKWRNLNGHNLFGLVYNDLSKYNFAFQHYVQLTRLQIQTSPPASEKTEVKMFERSVQNNRYCFVENAHKSKFLADCEYEVLKAWYDWIENNVDISLDLIVYLRSTPEVVWHRMVKRGRTEENAVPLDYLKEIHSFYEQWLNSPEKVKCKIITIDADKDLENVLEQITYHSSAILGGKINDQES
ncbi:thymidine kinase 2, mitochondrial-like [Arctopsyche grandis]|uniref:thymidine kinase 2, mitochondrial-like n=1 Tax=Arctopsyche grandis TaxID=121162 RepID=UPI00406DA00C